MRFGTPASQSLKAAIHLPVVLSGPGASEFLDSVKNSFNLHDVIDLSVTDQGFADGDTIVYLHFTREISIRGKELKEAEGIIIMVGGTLALQFDSKGELSSYSLEEPTEDSAVEGKQGLVKLLQSGTVYFATLGETVDTQRLIKDGKRFYVQVDKAGLKRLHRVYV